MDIIEARDLRYNEVKQHCLSGETITVKANIPGADKNLPEAHLIVYYFANLLKDKICNTNYLGGCDGLSLIANVKNGISNIKAYAEDLENNHFLGRIVDIDVYNVKGESYSRGSMRKCYICDKPAFVCGRDRTHPIQELLSFIKTNTREFFYEFITKLVKDSMLTELNLENKFGLVTPTSNGSHKDLNYDIMSQTINVISPVITKCFFVGLDNEIDDIFKKIVPIGLDAEDKMLSITNGANAYKGFIFLAGVLLASVGYTIKDSGKYDDIFENVKIITKNLCPQNTFGANAYKNGFGGIRKEAQQGFLSVKKAQEHLKNGLLHTLCYIVGIIDDSVLLKRSGSLDRYNYYKNIISNINIEDKNSVIALTNECILDNISIGGSADTLAGSVMLNGLKNVFFSV